MAKITGKLHYANVRVTPLDIEQQRKRLVSAAIIHINNFPGFLQIAHYRPDCSVKSGDIFFFVIDGHYYGKHEFWSPERNYSDSFLRLPAFLRIGN
jgi:hypothetical protein